MTDVLNMLAAEYPNAQRSSNPFDVLDDSIKQQYKQSK